MGGAWKGPMGQTLRSQEGPKAGLVSEVLSEWVSGLGPFLPLPTAPPILLPGGPASRDTGEGRPTPCCRQPGAEAWSGLGPPAPEAMGRGQVRDGGDRGSTGSDPRWCRACWVPRSWGSALEASDSG